MEVTRPTSDGVPPLLPLPPVPSRHISSTIWSRWLVMVSSLLGKKFLLVIPVVSSTKSCRLNGTLLLLLAGRGLLLVFFSDPAGELLILTTKSSTLRQLSCSTMWSLFTNVYIVVIATPRPSLGHPHSWHPRSSQWLISGKMSIDLLSLLSRAEISPWRNIYWTTYTNQMLLQ